ncbi:hypothetical protein FGIG_12013 [Fasciola gigantica]|uniref:Uncharacterized protein n=1 Tax=Fasciola gigantica TaxID=46835 RepID=A0A504YC99_FASGI|nr:hypothetical protein FGIG_12013 [Fasciola gigantica]
MTTIPRRYTRGRKAVRTSTAPMLLSASERQKLVSNTPQSTESNLSSYSCLYPSLLSTKSEIPKSKLHDSLYGTDQSVSLYELNHSHGLFPPRPADHSHPPSTPSTPPWARTEIQSKYSLRQQLKEVMESRTPSDSSRPATQRHRRELTRCWSRERVIRSEVILSVRHPSGQSCVDLTSAGHVPFGSMESVLSKSTGGLLASSPRRLTTVDGHLSPVSPWTGSNHSLLTTSTASSVLAFCAGRLIPIRTEKTAHPSNMGRAARIDGLFDHTEPSIIALKRVTSTPERPNPIGLEHALPPKQLGSTRNLWVDVMAVGRVWHVSSQCDSANTILKTSCTYLKETEHCTMHRSVF